MSGRDVNASLRAFYDSVMVPNWEDLRMELLVQGYRRWGGQSLRGRATGYQRGGPVQPLTALPAYLNGRYGLANCVGTNPLYPGDPRQATGTPMSTPTDPTTFLVAVPPDPTAPGGWHVNSAYPE